MSVGVEFWIKDTYGKTPSQIIAETDLPTTFRIVWELLTDLDKKQFLATDVTLVNENGDEVKTRLGGYKLFLTLINSVDEQVSIIEALLRSMGITKKMQDDAQAAALKKSQDLSTQNQTGKTFLTSSPQSTDGQTNTSFPSPESKSEIKFSQSSKDSHVTKVS